MSASSPQSSIYTTDTPKVARKKIMNAFTGGRETVAEQRKKGGKPEVCSVHQYLTYIFEEDDEALMDQCERCKQGDLLCGEHKEYLAEKVEQFLVKHQEKREKARDVIEDFMVRD
jgi:tryptophanyl-tRNA synthetase